jgi:hypothetical protein
MYSTRSRMSWVQRKIELTGYTTLKVHKKDCMQPVMCYAMEYVSGSKRYDYVMVQFENNDGSLATCPAIIICFVCYDKTPGIPTLHFVDCVGLGLQEIRAMNQTDHHIYAVVHNAKKYLSYDEFQNDFFCQFFLCDVTCCMYIIKVEDIAGPLFLFNNYGSAGIVANIVECALPQSKWGRHFSDCIFI